MNENFQQSPKGFFYHQALARFNWLSHGFSLRHPAGTNEECSLGFNDYLPDSTVKSNRRHFLHCLGFPGIIDPCAGESIPLTLETIPLLLSLRQIHSSLIHRVGVANWRLFPAEGDGICTDHPGLVLSILTADCMPILLVDQRLRIILALHSGWRGTLRELPSKAVHFLIQEFGTQTIDCLAVIGPSIRSCCYQVGAEVQTAFAESCGSSHDLFLKPDPQVPGKFRLDPPVAAQHQFLRAGLLPENIYADPPCTCCQKNRFFSHRGDSAQTGRMMAVIGIRG
jgi:YfiH family protein